MEQALHYIQNLMQKPMMGRELTIPPNTSAFFVNSNMASYKIPPIISSTAEDPKKALTVCGS